MPRYIDVDALLEQIAIDSKGIEGSYGDTWEFMGTIKSMPTITIDHIADDKKAAISWGHENGLIDREQAIDALWKAMYEYEDKTEKQFLESEELDVSDWILHRIFVQNMSDIDRQTILNLPPVQPEHAIPLSWIEGHIKWLKSLDNAFSTLIAAQISVMVNKWKDEHNE